MVSTNGAYHAGECYQYWNNGTDKTRVPKAENNLGILVCAGD